MVRSPPRHYCETGAGDARRSGERGAERAAFQEWPVRAPALAVSSVGVSAAAAPGVTLALAGIALIAKLALGARRPHDAVAAAVGELNARMETMSRELADVLERAR